MTGCIILDSDMPPARKNGKRLPCEVLQAENTKLRELVDYMTPIAMYAASERERERMRELGVDE